MRQALLALQDRLDALDKAHREFSEATRQAVEARRAQADLRDQPPNFFFSFFRNTGAGAAWYTAFTAPEDMILKAAWWTQSGNVERTCLAIVPPGETITSNHLNFGNALYANKFIDTHFVYSLSGVVKTTWGPAGILVRKSHQVWHYDNAGQGAKVHGVRLDFAAPSPGFKYRYF